MTDISVANGSTFKDRKVGLVVFGIFQILLGALCALFVPLMILGTIAGRNAAPGTSLSTAIPGLLVYVFLSAWFITMGIGSILARRWARALSLIFSWLWLICGISGMIFMFVLMPDMFAQMNQGGQMPPRALKIVKIVMFGTLSIIYLALPGMFLFFYRSRHVKATCEARDVHARWTDRRPLPVLALSLMFGFWAASMLFLGFYNWVLPCCGFILTGPAGAIAAIAFMLLTGYISWGTWQLRVAAWWCAVLASVFWMLSTIITFSRLDLLELYEKMNFPPEQIEIMKQAAIPQSPTMIAFFIAWFVGFLVYLLYTKKFFKPAAQA